MYLDSPIYKGYLETHKETKQLLLPRLLDNLKKSDPSLNDEEWACDSFQTFLYGNGQDDLANQIAAREAKAKVAAAKKKAPKKETK